VVTDDLRRSRLTVFFRLLLAIPVTAQYPSFNVGLDAAPAGSPTA
jgi:hypothetical protein